MKPELYLSQLLLHLSLYIVYVNGNILNKNLSLGSIINISVHIFYLVDYEIKRKGDKAEEALQSLI